jgi:hypothetical protein
MEGSEEVEQIDESTAVAMLVGAALKYGDIRAKTTSSSVAIVRAEYDLREAALALHRLYPQEI